MATALGCVLVDLETGEAALVDDELPAAGTAGVTLPLLIAADQAGERVAAVVERRPPLVLSNDGGRTWEEAGGGLPAGTAIAIHPEDPDVLLFSSESRLLRLGGRRAVLAGARPRADRDHGRRFLVG